MTAGSIQRWGRGASIEPGGHRNLCQMHVCERRLSNGIIRALRLRQGRFFGRLLRIYLGLFGMLLFLSLQLQLALDCRIPVVLDGIVSSTRNVFGNQTPPVSEPANGAAQPKTENN